MKKIFLLFVFLPMIVIAQTDATTTTDAASTVPAISSDGYSDLASKLKATTAKVLAAAKSAQSTGANVPVMEAITKVDSFASYYANFHSACVDSQATAKALCREETSPNLQSTLNQVNTLMSLVTASGVMNACSIMGKAMALAETGLTAYTAACSAARATCESSCSTVFSNISQIKKWAPDVLCKMPCKVMATVEPDYSTQTAACKALTDVIYSEWQTNVVDTANLETNENDASPAKSIASKNKACTYTYASMIISAGTGILSIVKSAKAANNCEDQTNGTSSATATTTDLCSLSTYTATPDCICQANPRLAGCANSLEKSGSAATTALTAQSSPNAASTTSTDGSSLDLSSLSSNPTGATGASSSSTAAGAGVPTGGGAGLSGSGGGAGSTGTDSSDIRKALNANILGTGSAGGGGGGWGSSGSNTDSTQYRAYLPGGAKDPTKAAGESTWTKEVTGQAGKSNWEKIRDRYRDNTSTLLNN